ncbi:MAG TPA: class I SAM-dependent methyltransferase [Candidatus Gastranaerophilales bacterium]|nr:class I SAM-dependent methyltransferase [Candidatus Gastranaerophilales bacterium]
MSCYLCCNSSLSLIKDRVRDRTDLNVLKCNNCGLVFLDKKDHINESFYEQGGMGKSVNLGNIVNVTDKTDTEKRFNLHNNLFINKRILDFGCGKGSLLKKIKEANIAAELYALEPNKNCQTALKNDFHVYSGIEEIPDESLDIITLFHVFEHIKDPLQVLNRLYPKLAEEGKIIIEVPSSNDVLLHLYDCKPFSDFTYWSCHLYLFNQANLRTLLEKTSFKIDSIRQYQRYTLANHLHWLAKGKPAGHIEWDFLDSEELQIQYEKKLAEIEQCDSLIAILEK